MTEVSKNAAVFLARSHAFLEAAWMPVRHLFKQPDAAPLVFEVRRTGLAMMRGLNGSARNWKRNQRARDELTQSGLILAGDLTPEGRWWIRSRTWPFEIGQVREALRRLKFCLARGWCRKDGWAPETLIAAAPWGESTEPFAALQACLSPALIDGWLQSQCTVRGHCFYRLTDSKADIDSLLQDSLPEVGELCSGLCNVYDREVVNTRRWFVTAKIPLQEIGEIPLPVALPLLDESKDYNDVADIAPLFPSANA